MWLTVVLLGIAVNLEPTRFILIPMLLARERPMVQLLAYLLGCVTVNLVFGFLILFVFHRNPLGTSTSGGGKAQLAVGLLALAVGAVMAARSLANRGGAEPTDQPNGKGDRFSEHMRGFLRRGRSPWLAGVLGMCVGIPSVDYLAVLVIIGTSEKPPAQQAAALLTFVALGSLVVMAPLVGHLLAPAATLRRIERFGVWIRSRSQLEYAGLLSLVGVVLIGMGLSRL